MIEFDQWMREAPIDLEIEIAKAKAANAYWQDRLYTLLSVKRLKDATPPQEQSIVDVKEIPPCLGDEKVWDPHSKKCKACSSKDECDAEMAKILGGK